jgi:hypothetical protein
VSSEDLRLHEDERVDVAIREYFLVKESGFYGNGNFKLVPSWNKYINIFRDYVKI